MEPKPVIQNEGTPCGHCNAPLRAVEVFPGTRLLEGGGLFAMATYECTGVLPHRWGEQTDTLMPRTLRLVSLENPEVVREAAGLTLSKLEIGELEAEKAHDWERWSVYRAELARRHGARETGLE